MGIPLRGFAGGYGDFFLKVVFIAGEPYGEAGMAMAIPMHGFAGQYRQRVRCYDDFLQGLVVAARVPVVIIASEPYGGAGFWETILLHPFVGRYRQPVCPYDDSVVYCYRV